MEINKTIAENGKAGFMPVRDRYTAFVNIIQALTGRPNQSIVCGIGVVVVDYNMNVVATFRSFGAPFTKNWEITGDYSKYLKHDVLAKCGNLDNSVIKVIGQLVRMGVTRLYFRSNKSLGALKGTCSMYSYPELSSWLTAHSYSLPGLFCGGREDVSLADLSYYYEVKPYGFNHDCVAQAFKLFMIWAAILGKGLSEETANNFRKEFRISNRKEWDFKHEIEIGKAELSGAISPRTIVSEYQLL